MTGLQPILPECPARFNLAEYSNKATALLEYLYCTLITCSWYLNHHSFVFDPIFSQSLKGYSTLTSANAFQISAYSL